MKRISILLAVVLLAACATGYKTSGEYFFRGESYLKDNNPEQALASFEKALKINPDNIDVYASRGSTHYFMGNYQAAIDDFYIVVKARPYDAVSYNAMASALAAGGSFANALEFSDIAVKLAPDNLEALFTRGAINFSLGRYTDAEKDYTSIIKTRPFADVYRARAAVYEKLGKQKEAEKDIELSKAEGLPIHINPYVK